MANLSEKNFGWLDAVLIYRDLRMAKIFFLYILQGFPWVLIGSMVTLWLKEDGFSRASIGLFGLAFTVYAFNLCWAPLVDAVRLPFLAARFGRRRAWIALMQGIIFIATAAMAAQNPAENVWFIALLCVVIAAAGATQDVAIDALRIEMFGENEVRKVGAGAAMATAGWWSGFGVLGALALYLADFFQSAGYAGYWQAAYLTLLIVVAAGIAGLLLFIPEAAQTAGARAQSRDADAFRKRLFKQGGGASARIGGMLAAAYAMPIINFARRHSVNIALLIIAAVVLFKIGEAFLGRMSLVFYKEIGFSKSDIATYSKLAGAVSVCVFAVIGSAINARYGLFRGLLIGGVAMASTNLLFALMAAVGPEKWLFAAAVIADQFTTAISTVAFVAFISQLCDRAYPAAQYAAFASLGNLSRTTLAAGSGFVVDALDGRWDLFFILTALMVLPSLILLIGLRRKLAPLLAGATTKLI